MKTVFDNRAGGTVEAVAAIYVTGAMISLTNAGKIIGDIVNTNSGHDVVVNYSKITGALDLAGGDDVPTATPRRHE